MFRDLKGKPESQEKQRLLTSERRGSRRCGFEPSFVAERFDQARRWVAPQEVLSRSTPRTSSENAPAGTGNTKKDKTQQHHHDKILICTWRGDLPLHGSPRRGQSLSPPNCPNPKDLESVSPVLRPAPRRTSYVQRKMINGECPFGQSSLWVVRIRLQRRD